MAHHLYYYPIERRRDFAAAWEYVDLRGDRYAPALHPALTPFYLDAIRKLAGTRRDAQFERLMRLVAENEDNLSQVRTLLDDLYVSSLTSQQRAIVARNRLRLGVSDSRSEMTDAFETLRLEYFETLAPDPLAMRRLCDFTFRDADLIRRMSQRLNEEEWTEGTLREPILGPFWKPAAHPPHKTGVRPAKPERPAPDPRSAFPNPA